MSIGNKCTWQGVKTGLDSKYEVDGKIAERLFTKQWKEHMPRKAACFARGLKKSHVGPFIEICSELVICMTGDGIPTCA
jgi:hypothetical protein